MERKPIDITDELLRFIYLENGDDKIQAQQLSFILSDEVTVEMSAAQKEKLFHKLSAVHEAESLGQLIRKKMTEAGTAPENLSAGMALPLQVVQNLLEDKIYTNNIPVMLFRRLLGTLHISFNAAEKAIRRTFDLLQNSVTPQSASSSLYPAMRKNMSAMREDNLYVNVQSGAKELYENKEALDKYVNRLQELMNQ